MDVINCRNVNDGFVKAMDMLSFDQQDIRESRAGNVIEHDVPVATVYEKPYERVLFEEIRDANPFFHFMEGLWMLAGRNDLEFVKQYNQRMSEYSDDGKTLHGAYGWRWIDYFEKTPVNKINQLEIIIRRLKEDPTDRRCVLQMWDPVQDLDRKGVDVPCNTTIYFKVRNNELLMTVCCRSNDAIWGTFGANIVHMSMLHEYVASAIDVSIGAYTQVSDSFHAYTKVFEDMHNQLEEADVFDYYSMKHFENPYENRSINYYPMVNSDSIEDWNKDLYKFLERKPFEDIEFDDIFFSHVAVPLQDAWFLHKQGETDDAMSEVQNCIATDWSTAGFDWLLRRAK
jgi:thymidylate synthase